MDTLPYKSINNDTQNDVLIAIKSWFFYLVKYWWLFILIVGAAGVAGFIYATKDKPKYESRLTFALEDNGSSGLGGALGLASEFGFNIGSGKDVFAGDNILEIFTSRKMIEKVLLSTDTLNGKPTTIVDELILLSESKESLLKSPRLSKVSFPVGLAREKFSYLQDSILFVIYAGIAEGSLIARKPDKKFNIYELKFISPNERLSKIFVEILIKETTAFYTDLRSKRSKETLEILEQRVASLKGSMNAAISNRASAQDANLNPAFAQAQVPLQRREADIRVYGSAYGELFKNLELARYQYLKSIPLLQIVDAPNYPMKRIKMGRLNTAIIFGFIAGVILLAFLVLKKYLTTTTTQNEAIQKDEQ